MYLCTYANLPRIPIHTTVFCWESVVFFRRSETVTFFTENSSTRHLIIEGEHSVSFLFCLPFVNVINSSLHTVWSDNMTCSKLISIKPSLAPISFAVHMQLPVPVKPLGKAGDVTYEAFEMILMSLHMSKSSVYIVDECAPIFWAENIPEPHFTGIS